LACLADGMSFDHLLPASRRNSRSLIWARMVLINGAYKWCQQHWPRGSPWDTPGPRKVPQGLGFAHTSALLGVLVRSSPKPPIQAPRLGFIRSSLRIQRVTSAILGT
jgi:hypothetical protein